MCMDEREKLKQELEAELQWVKYRMRMLEIIEEKLLRMRKISDMAKRSDISLDEIESINIEINNLVQEVKALDGESKKLDKI